jgi:hypothetical protein
MEGGRPRRTAHMTNRQVVTWRVPRPSFYPDNRQDRVSFAHSEGETDRLVWSGCGSLASRNLLKRPRLGGRSVAKG